MVNGCQLCLPLKLNRSRVEREDLAQNIILAWSQRKSISHSVALASLFHIDVFFNSLHEEDLKTLRDLMSQGSDNIKVFNLETYEDH
jgi:hypothetical protein